MTFEENPFRVLNVSIHDTKATIVDAAEDLTFMNPDDEEIIERARDILLNPRKRIAAEVNLLVDEKLDVENLSEDILRVDKKFSALNAETLREQINAARAKSKFPAVNDTKAIADELKNLRDEIRSKIQSKLQNANHKMRVSFANFLVDKLAAGNFGVVVEDFFDSYKLEMTAFIDETTEKILALSNKFEFKFKAEFSQYLYELEPQLTAFVEAKRPLDRFSMLLGSNKFDDSEEIFYAVRATAIDLYNEKDLVDYPLKITRLLAEKFSYLPKLAEMIRKDVTFLEKAQSRRPTQSFLHAKSKLDAILAELDDKLHFNRSRGKNNIMYYIDVFKPRHKVTLQEIMNSKSYKPDEWKVLSAIAASIYLKLAASMTWGDFRPHLTCELYQQALIYAEKTDDDEFISVARKKVEEWDKIISQVRANERNDSENFGCLEGCGSVFWIIIILIFISAFFR